MRYMVLGCLLLVPLLLAATPGDPSPQAKYGAVQVVCDDGGTNHATPIPATPLNKRNALNIQNLDTVNDLWCGFDAKVTSTTGTKVSKNGGIFQADIKYWAGLPANGADGGLPTNPKFYCTIATCSATAVNQASPNDVRYLETE